MVEGNHAQPEDEQRGYETSAPNPEIVHAIAQKSVAEHLHDRSDRVDEEHDFPFGRDLGEGIDYRRRVHEEPQAEAHELAQVLVLGGERRDKDAYAHAQERDLDYEDGCKQYPPGGVNRSPRDEVEDIEYYKEEELYYEGEKAVDRIGDRHREAGEIDLAEETRVAVEGVLALGQRDGKESPEHRARKVKEGLGNAVGSHLRDAPEHEHVHDGGHQRLEDEPEGPEDSLLVHRHEIAPDEEVQ